MRDDRESTTNNASKPSNSTSSDIDEPGLQNIKSSIKKTPKKTRPFKNTSPFAHSEARSLSAPPTPQRRRHPSPTGTDKPVGTWAPSDRIAMVGCPRTSHRPCLLMTTTANAHQSAAYDLMNVRTARTQHHRKKQRYKETLKGTHIKHTVPSALYAYSLHAFARQPSLVCAMYCAVVKMPNNFVTSPVRLRRLSYVYLPMALNM